MISVQRMRELEANADFLGVSFAEMMENAGKGVARAVAKRYRVKGKRVVVLCGQGNNGGDGFVMARELAKAGATVKIHFFGVSRKLSPEAFEAYNKVPARLFADNKKMDLRANDLVVDALLGTGTKGRVREPLKGAIQAINKSRAKKICVDVPSGLDPDNGKGRLFVWPDIVYAFHALKPGLKRFGKKVQVIDIGIPPAAERFVGAGDAKKVLKKHAAESHKGQNGKTLVVAGSDDLPGAAVMASLAAHAVARTGNDLVFVAAPEGVAWTINNYLPDVVATKLPGKRVEPTHLKELVAAAKKTDAVLIGPGLGRAPETAAAVKAFAQRAKKPLVVDADAIKALAKTRFKGKAIVTPHARELEAFTGKKTPTKLDAKIGAAEAAARKANCVVLLKGRVDIITDGKNTKLNRLGNPGMTVGGTGDILAGLCAGFLARGASPLDAAAAAAWLNGLAGETARQWKGYSFIASDMLMVLPQLLKELGFK